MPLTKGFKKLKKNVSKEYLGKPVAVKWRPKYGKKYSKKEVTGIAYAIAKKKKIKIHSLY